MVALSPKYRQTAGLVVSAFLVGTSERFIVESFVTTSTLAAN
jgi:hypothetical protein